MKLDRNFQVVPRNKLLQINNQLNKQTDRHKYLHRSHKFAKTLSHISYVQSTNPRKGQV